MSAPIRVTVALSPAPRKVLEVALVLQDGASVAQAVQASGLLVQLAGQMPAGYGVWGQRAAPERLLRDQDRVEIYRPLLVDPKVARRTRFAKQGVRAAGLFASKRPGAKAGY